MTWTLRRHLGVLDFCNSAEKFKSRNSKSCPWRGHVWIWHWMYHIREPPSRIPVSTAWAHSFMDHIMAGPASGHRGRMGFPATVRNSAGWGLLLTSMLPGPNRVSVWNADLPQEKQPSSCTYDLLGVREKPLQPPSSWRPQGNEGNPQAGRCVILQHRQSPWTEQDCTHQAAPAWPLDYLRVTWHANLWPSRICFNKAREGRGCKQTNKKSIF